MKLPPKQVATAFVTVEIASILFIRLLQEASRAHLRMTFEFLRLQQDALLGFLPDWFRLLQLSQQPTPRMEVLKVIVTTLATIAVIVSAPQKAFTLWALLRIVLGEALASSSIGGVKRAILEPNNLLD